eukprot:TRINITY_DN27076_c0_g1_i1.p1 TRINITY_DN27076_c0_g1~~TRINITY_DN27076_c0_g1_i1.p1  ORF type:complete len:482 (-),score=86.81 TRINITY_DN27076_c0_g1_i1:105-1487(-)
MCEGENSKGFPGKPFGFRRFLHSVGRLGRFLTKKPHEGEGPCDSTKRIQWIADFTKQYRLAGEVRPSGQEGTDVRHANRISDGKAFAVKVRNKTVSEQSAFANPEVEATWRASMELMLNCYPSDNIGAILQVLEDDSCYYVIMEFVDGEDLFDLMQSRRLGDQDLRLIIGQLLHAVGELHESGIIHRDIKLENVVVRKDLSVKLIDFDDIESWPPHPLRDETTRWVCGTDQYIAPEAYLGNFSPASDLFAVGALLYRMLFGRFPFNILLFNDKPGENYVGSPKMRIISARLGQSMVDWETRNRLHLPPTAGAVAFCKRLMALDKDNRYASAAEALEDAWFAETPLQGEAVQDARFIVCPHPLQSRMAGDELQRAAQSATSWRIPDMKDEEDVDVLDFDEVDKTSWNEEAQADTAPPSPKLMPSMPDLQGSKSMGSEASSSIELAFPPGWILDAAPDVTIR